MLKRRRSLMIAVLLVAAACRDVTNVDPSRVRVAPQAPSQDLLPGNGPCTNCVFGPRVLSKPGTGTKTFDGRFVGDPAADYMLVVKSGNASASVEVWLNGAKVMSRSDLEVANGAEAAKPLIVKSDNVLVVNLYGSKGASATIAVVRVQVAQVDLPGLPLDSIAFSAIHAQGTVSSDGRFEFAPLPVGASPVVFLESPHLSDVLPLVMPAVAGARVTVDAALVAKSYVALHPDVGPVGSADQPRLFAKLDSLQSLAALEAEVHAAVAAGSSILDWPAAEAAARIVISELVSSSALPRISLGSTLAAPRPIGTVCPGIQPGPVSRTPQVCRDPQGVWGVENPRALFLGARIDGKATAFVDPADFQSHWYFFRTTLPRWTGLQLVSTSSAHELELYDGFGTGSDLATTGANAALIIGKGLQAFGIPDVTVVQCGVGIFQAGGAAVSLAAASVSNGVANWRGSNDIKVFASSLSAVTNLIFKCVQSAIGTGTGISPTTKQLTHYFSTASKLLKRATWVLSGGAASEMGFVLGAAFDPLPTNRYAFYDDGSGHLTVDGAVWFTSNVAGAVVTANGSVLGGTPLPAIDLPVGSVPYSIGAAGYRTYSGTAITLAGRWIAVNALLTPASTAGLVAHYPFEGNANDVSGNGYHATFNTASLASGVSGQNNSAYHFNGTSEIRLPESPTNGLASGTISLWVRLDDTNAQYNIFAKGPAANTYPMRAQYGGGPPITQWCFIVNTPPPGDCSSPVNSYTPSSTTYGFTNWHLYTFTWSPTGRRIYLDGNLTLSIAGAAIAPNAGELILSPPSALGQERLKGSIDDVRIYNYELTLSQVAALVNAPPGPPPPPPSASLLAHYPLDGNASDVTTSPINGSLTNVTFVPGRVGTGNAARFAGGASYVQAPVASGSKLAFKTTDRYSVAMWMRPDARPTGPSNWLAYTMGRNEFSSSIQLRPDGTAFAGNCTPTEFCFSAYGPTGTVVPGQWYHVAQVYDGATQSMQFFLNGAPAGTVSFAFSARAIDQAFNIGGTPVDPSNGFIGSIDDVRVYTGLLSAAEISALATAPAGSSGLVAFYGLDGNGNDGSAYGNHGTLTGVAAAPGRTGVAGTALLFSGSNSVVTIPSNPQIAGLNGDMTLVFWMKKGATDITGAMLPIARREFGNRIHFITYMQPGGVAFQCCSAGGSDWGAFYTPGGNGLATLNDGAWHQIAITHRFGAGGTTTLYLDGAQLAGSYLFGAAGASAPTIVADLLIGRQASTSAGQFEGYLDNVYIFNTILTPSQIAQLP
ncbi:MAG: hypothetical protein IT360_04230 [Gemmatimonadaceae bacterium]|nr:hypothetical protein [Gemmatimonadaceae bacterium]